ncbi:hypothetical protein HNW77_06585 [Komagataeibacter sp. AV436]|uniref:Uncharacterized protein n=1 Tax=Komagataeibacter melomenusus TaxID=2766578 RepID=A0ABX2ACR2_9PROT|nr:hypothetical protein [Komagataeibacter melomenusus]MBV1830431.1 hypothetical protein [Komagataeibacter melomenusus]NPC66060.1 hypothetical protein [Komagataeibacter melomenusus]
MNNEDARRLLLYFVDKYVSDPALKEKLMDLGLNRRDVYGSPPVKGIMYAVLENMNGQMDQDDKEEMYKLQFHFS